MLQRQQRLARDLLGQRRHVAVVDDLDAVDLAVDVGGHQVGRDLARVGVRRAVGEARVGALGLAAAERQRRHAAAPGGVPDGRLAAALVLDARADARADDLRVERAREAAVARDEQDADLVLGLVLVEDRQVRDVARGLRRLAGHPPDRARVGPQRLDALLGPAQARGGDHLHRARDLLDVLDRRDAALDVLEGHGGWLGLRPDGLALFVGVRRTDFLRPSSARSSSSSESGWPSSSRS